MTQAKTKLGPRHTARKQRDRIRVCASPKCVAPISRAQIHKHAEYSPPRGFSLIELLIALVIFAVMAGLAWGGLNSIVRTRSELAADEADFHAMARALGSLERDLRQAVARKVRGNYAQFLPELAGTNDRIEFTRTGFANPQAELRSNLQRVGYALENGKLIRAVYPVLDRAPGTQPIVTVLRDRVASLRLRYLDAQAHWQDVWPAPTNAVGDSIVRALPLAVEIRLEIAPYGEITRIVELVADFMPPGTRFPNATPGAP